MHAVSVVGGGGRIDALVCPYSKTDRERERERERGSGSVYS